ncbi:MAG: outer membrane protein assembly factor BamE [Gammaproteobacteria bacterium]|nr:outer membrane protein assembly factor BamE [Gammaproteobacteria bacterium]MBU1647667.1 outer membrane protein assembly factor BamE [Gammaproteobacteria bacterium]MBU1971813.1 outer membrane protein assembly factor BamE [Gammaproteobacteria bacterium]
MCALALLLAACAGVADLRPGESRIEDVQRSLGAPQLQWQDAGGTTHLAYPRGPEGLKTFIARIGPDGRLQGIENVLDEQHFAAIKPGMGKEQVLRLLGPPQPQRTIYFAARDELAWEWRYCDAGNGEARFSVLFDATSETVRSSFSLLDTCESGRCWCGH